LTRGTVCVPGCGTGHDAIAWAGAGFSAHGFDFAPSAIQLATARAAAAGSSARFQLGNFLSDTPPQTFDWVFEHTLFLRDPTRRAGPIRASLARMAEAGRPLPGRELPDPRHRRPTLRHDARRIVGAILAPVRAAGGVGAALLSQPDRVGANDVVAASRLGSSGKSGRGLPQSKTLRESQGRWQVRQVLECASPLALSGVR